ncbi:uncharacterized protein TA14955 [Theileria annulata]|uniref:SfiI-subtelomeric related protein family member n=1 Tax=Theileria annulata TaxID=5874 RepID=Q4UFB3_THEAN|nr:uncharacterized protein TA14955 [Theileria annulata]CAI74226.1 hypothetical protein TA14955 [Theileria annulata]|eukprot:XP_951958.1 hypothetical protein TA14955 [Theileria annulata]
MAFLRELLLLLAFASYVQGSEVELDLSNASRDNFDVVEFETGPASVTRITPKLGVHVNRITDTLDGVWSPLSKDFSVKSFEIHQRSGHNSIGHLALFEKNVTSPSGPQEDDNSHQNLGESLSEKVVYSNLYFTKRDRGWFPLTKYHFDVLKDDMESLDAILDLHNFSDSLVSVSHLEDKVTRELLLARRLSRVTRVNHNGDLVWSSAGTELFKSAFLSYNTMNSLVLVKMTLTTPNATYNPLDEKSSRYYLDRTLYFYKNKSLVWKTVNQTFYEETLELLRIQFAYFSRRFHKLTLDVLPMLDGSDSDNPLYFDFRVEKKEYRGVKVAMVSPLGEATLTLVKSGDSLLWVSENDRTYCRDVHLYHLGDSSTLVDLCLASNPSDTCQYKFFKLESGHWGSLSQDNYKHLLNNDEISVVLELNNTDLFFCSKAVYKRNGVPITHITANDGYYFDKVKELELELWNSTRFLKCKKVFHVNLNNFNFISLLVEDPLNNTSHLLYYQKISQPNKDSTNEGVWMPITEAVHSSLMHSLLMKISFDFDLTEFISDMRSKHSVPFDLDSFPETNLDRTNKNYSLSLFRHNNVPMVRVYPAFTSHLANFREGSNVIWSSKPNRKLFFLEFNYAEQPSMVLLLFSDENDVLRTSYYSRVNGKWISVTIDELQNFFGKVSTVQDQKFFTLDIGKLLPSNKYTYQIDHLATPPSCLVEPSYGHKIDKLVDGAETIWSFNSFPKDASTPYGRIGNDDYTRGYEDLVYATFVPYDDPKFVTTVTLSQSHHLYLNHYLKQDDGVWKSVNTSEYFEELEEYSAEYYQGEEIVDLSDVFMGERRDYYEFVDSSYYGMDHYGVLKFTDKVERLSIYVNGVHLYKLPKATYLKELTFFPSNQPKVISLEYQSSNNDSNFLYFSQSDFTDADPFVKILNQYVQVDEHEYTKQFEKLLMLNKYTSLDLATYYKMVEDFEETNSDERDLVSYMHEKLNNTQTNNGKAVESPLKHSVYNYLGVNLVVAEVNPYYVLRGVNDGIDIVTAYNFYPSTKIYFTVNNEYFLSIYYRDANSQDLKMLNYEKWNRRWTHKIICFHRALQVLINFASKPVSVDMFHLRCGHELKLVTSQSFSGFFTNTLSSKPGYQIKLIYYNSVPIYNADNGLSKKIGPEDSLENVIEITFFPLLRPKVLRISSNTNSTIINKYYKITNLLDTDSAKPSTTSIITSLNVFDYYSLLESFGRMYEFLVDITELHTTDDYRLSNHTVSNTSYLILTPNKGKNLVLLTQGRNVIWEAQDELVNYLILYPQHKPFLALIYYNKSDREGVYHYRYMSSVNKWVKTSEDYALDKFRLRKENLMPMTLDLSTLPNKNLEEKDYMSNLHLNLCRKKIYGLVFTIVKPSFSTYIVAVKHNGKILFDINADQNSHSDHSNRILSAVYAFKDDPKILALNYVKNFVPSQAYFRKNDEGVWEEISSTEYGKFLFLLKRFTMNPVVLDIDNPNPHFFTTYFDRSNKNFTMTRITPMDNYKISKVVRSNSSNAKDPFKDLKLFDSDQNPVQPVEEIFAVQDKTVFYVEYTDGSPSLMRIYYSTDMMFQVQKAYFVLEEGVYKPTTEENFNRLMSLAKIAGTQVKYNLDPYYRVGSPVYDNDGYEETVETVYNEKIDVVYPNSEVNISPIMFKEANVWEAHPHYQTLSIVSYPSKDPNQMMVNFKDLLKSVVYSQYYKKAKESGPSEKVVWKSSILYSNAVFDKNVKSVDYDLSDTKVHTSLTVFTFEREGLYTTVVLPNKGTRVTSISMQNRKIWTPNQGNSTSPSEELVKFYFTPSIDPRVLVVYYRDSDGYVRLKDFARELTSLEWKESYSKFMSYYLDMLDSSLSLNLNSFDKSNFIFSNYYRYGFKFVLLYPLLSTNVTKVFSKPADSASDLTDSDLIWMSEPNMECFSLNFAPPEDPKVLLLSYSESSLMKSVLYYKDSEKGWTLDSNNTHHQFVNRLLALENSFVYRLEDANSSLPSEFYTYEYTDAFGVRFGVCTPKSGKNLVSVTYNSMVVYEVKKGERILDVLSTQPNNPDHVILMLDTNVTDPESSKPTIIYKYMKRVLSWNEVGKTEFMESLMTNLSSDFFPLSLSSKDLHNRVLARLSVETSHDAFLDKVNELSTPSDYEHFTLDLANYKDNHRLSVKDYVESTVPRTVLRVKRNYLLTRLVHSDQLVWTSDNSSTPSDRFVTHVYFAPTEDPKVLTLFFRDCGNGVYSRRFFKENGWTEFNGLCTNLTNDSKLFTMLNKFVLDIHTDSMRYSNSFFKKELVYEANTYFMKISPKENVDVVKLMCKELQIWDKGEYDNFKSVLVYPINTPKFAKLYLGTNNGSHFFYFSKTNDFWAAQTEPEYKYSLKRYLSHSSDDFEPVDLSNTKNYINQTKKLNAFYVNLHKLAFTSVSPRFEYKISKVLFSPSQSVGDSDLNDFDFGPFNFDNHEKTQAGDVGDSDLKVLFEPTSNEDIRLVSFAPENDPKFVSITYTSTSNLIIPRTSPKLQESPYSPNQSPETVSDPTPTSSVSFSGDYAYLTGVPGYLPNYDGMEMSSPFYLSVNTNHYYLNEGVWTITDDATFKSLCLKWADEQFERKQPFDLDLDDLELNKENYDSADEELSGVYFTKFTPKAGFEFSHLRQYDKVIYRQKSFPIISLSVFPRNKPRFVKISHKMSPSLVNNYFFVSFYPYGLSQRDYPTFKKALLDYINSPDYSPPAEVSKALLSETALTSTQLVKVGEFTTDPQNSTLVLYGKKLDLLYYVDYNNDSKSGYRLSDGTKSDEIPNVVTTYSGKLYALNYYLVSPNQGYEFTKLYDKGDIVFDLGEDRVLKSLLLVPKTNPTHILVHYTSDQRFNFFELYHKQEKWVPSYHSLLKYKMKNITKYHLSPFSDFEYPLSQPLKEPKALDPNSTKPALPASPGLSTVEPEKTPADKKEDHPSFFSLKTVPTSKFMLHGNVKMLSDLEDKLEYKYDLLKNVALPQDSNNLQTGLSDLGFKFYIEDEKQYRLVFVDEPNHNITKLSVNGEVLLDLTNSKPYTTTSKEFSYDIESRGFTRENFEVYEGKFEDKEYVVVKVTQGTLSKVLEGESEVWDSKGKLVERFAYYPTFEPDHLLVSYKVQLENGESVTNYEYMHKVSNKWVEMDQESQLQLDADLKSNLFSSNPQETKPKLLKGVLLMPSKDPVKLHVWYTENNFDKFVSFSRSLGKWTHSTLVFNDLVSVKLKFVTAQLRADTVVFTGTQIPTLSEEASSSKSRKIMFESVSVNKHFLVEQPEKDNFLYLPLNNFLITNVSYGKHSFFKNADPQTDAANTKKVFAVYLTVENQKGQFYGKVNKLTVIFQDLLANVHVQSWFRDSTNKWSRFTLPDKEVSALKELLKDAKSRHSQKTKIDATAKSFTNFLTLTEKEQGTKGSLKLSGRVLVPDTPPAFFNYDLTTDEMDVYVSSLKTRFYSYAKDDAWNSFKVLAVKEGYEVTVLKTSDRVIYSTSTNEKHKSKAQYDRIIAVYISPSTKPDSVCLYLSDRFGAKKLVFFRKGSSDQSKGADEWSESTLLSSQFNSIKFKLDEALSRSTSLRLECFDYSKVLYYGGSFISHSQLTRSEYFVNTDSEVRNTPFKGFYSIVSEEENYIMLIPIKTNKISHIKYSTETLFSLESQFHTVRALMLTPRLNPDSLIVYYNDDENNDYYSTFTKLVTKTPTTSAQSNSPTSSTAHKLFGNPNKTWQQKQFMFFSSFGTIKKIHWNLETFENNNPALVSFSSRQRTGSSHYNLALTLTGVYTPEDGVSKEFVFFFDPNHKDSAYVFEGERVVEHKGAFDVVFKNSQSMNYLHVKSSPSYKVKSVMMDSQVLMDLDGTSDFDSLTLTPALNPSTILITAVDSISSLFYYFVNKENTWHTMGSDMTKYIKMKVLLHNASEEISQSHSHVDDLAESEVKRPTPVKEHKFEFNLSSYDALSEVYTLKKDSLSGHEFMLGRTKADSNVEKILDSNLLVWNNLGNSRVVRFGFSPLKDPNLLCVGYMFNDKEVYDFFHKTGGVWQPYSSLNNVPSLLTHISNLDLVNFVLDLSAVDEASEHYKLTKNKYNSLEIVTGNVSEGSVLASVVDKDLNVLPNFKILALKVQRFVYSQPENPTYFGLYFTENSKEGYELYNKQNGKWSLYFGMSEDRRLLLKELLASKDVDQFKSESKLFTPENEFYYNTRHSNNVSNKHYDVERQTSEYLDYVLVKVHKNQRLLKVLNNNLTVWVPKDAMTEVSRFMYYPPDNPIYFSIAYRTPSSKEDYFEYFYRSENKWYPYSEPMNIPQTLKRPLYFHKDSTSTGSSKVVFDLTLDLTSDFYKYRYDRHLTLYKNLLFETFVPKPEYEVSEVASSFKVIYSKLEDENITRISFYPSNDPKLLLVEVKTESSSGTQKTLVRKFVLKDTWVVNDDEFDNRALSYLNSEQKAVSLDLRQLTKENTTFDDFLVVKESLNGTFETLVVTPILGKRIVSIFDGPESVWSSDQASVDSCYLFPLESPELLSVLSTDLAIKYYSKLSGKWLEVSSASFDYLSSFYSGTPNVVELSHLSKFEPTSSFTDFNYLSPFNSHNVSSLETKTRYNFLKTGLLKYNSLVFGVASLVPRKFESDESASSQTPQVLALTYLGEPLFRLNNDQKFLDLIFYPLEKPSVVGFSFLQEGKHMQKFFLRSASEKHEWYEVDSLHFDNLFSLLSSHKLFNPGPADTLQQFQFDLHCEKSGDGFVLTKLSPKDHYHSVYVSETHRLSEIKDNGVSVYQVPETDFVYNLYYNLDPENTHLTLSYISSSLEFPPDSLGYLYFEKKNEEWVKSYSFTTKLLDLDQMLSSAQVPSTPAKQPTPMESNEFVYDMNKDKDSTANFELKVETMQGVKLATVLPRTNKKLVHLLDSEVKVWSSGPDDKCKRVLYAPFEQPKAAGVVYFTGEQETVKYFLKNPDGTWKETSPDQFIKVLIPEIVGKNNSVKVSLDFSNLANQVVSNLEKYKNIPQPTLTKTLGSNLLEEDISSFMVYSVPSELEVTNLYDREDLVYSSSMQVIKTLHLYANKNDMYLRVTTDFLDHKTSHYFHTTLRYENQSSTLPASPPNSLPATSHSSNLPTKSVGCEKFTFDLSASNKTNKFFTLYHGKYFGHDEVSVKVHSDYVLSRLVDGKTLVWEQTGHVFLVNFGYMPEKNPSHLCLGLYCAKGHRLWYTFYFKKGGKWHLYTLDDKLPDQLLELSELIESKTFFVFDLSAHSNSTEDYDVIESQHHGQKCKVVSLNKNRLLFDIRDGKEIIWSFENKKFAISFSFMPPENPNQLLVSYFSQNDMIVESFEKIDGKWMLTDNDSTLLSLPASPPNSLPATSHSSNLPTKSVGCEKFTFDLSASNKTNKFFTLYHGKYFGHDEVSVKVHSDYVLSRLVDGKTLVWEQTGHVFLVNFGYMPEKNPSHLCLGLYCAKGHRLWYTFYFKKGGKWHLYTLDDKLPDQISELAKNLFLEYGTDDLEQYRNQKEKQKPALVRGKWQKIEKEEFYNNFLHVSIIKEYVTFDISLIPDVGQYEVKEGFEFGHPIRISNPMPSLHVGIVSHGNKPVWQSNSINEHVKSIITVHENEYKYLLNSNTKLIQLYIKDRDKISAKYFKKLDNDDWAEIMEKEYANLYDKLCRDFKSLNEELKFVEHESDKLDSDAETVASTTHLCPSPDDLLVTVSYTDKKSGTLTTSQLKLNDSHKNLFVYTVDELQTVYVPILRNSVKKLRLDDFPFYEEDEASPDLLAFMTKLNTDGTLQRVILFFKHNYQLVHEAFVLDKGNWVSFSLLPDEESYLADLVLNATEQMKFL